MKTTKGVQNLLGDPKKAIVKISLPMVIAMSFQSLYNVIDAIWVAGLGSDALAAIGLFFPFMFAIMAISNGVGIGGSSAISRRIGQNNKDAADNIAVHSIVLGIIIGILLIGVIPFLGAIFSLIGASGITVTMAVEYSTILFGGAVVLLFTNIANAILRGEGDTKRAMYAIILGSVLNIVLDPIFIYVLNMGVAGAAWATLLSLVITGILFVYWLFIKKDTFLKISFEKFKLDINIIKEIFSIGLPASISHLTMAFSMFLLTAIVAKAGGNDGIAVFSTGWRIVSMGTIPLVGLATGVTVVTGAAYGSANPEKLEISYKYALKMGILVETIIAALILIFENQITYLFTYSENSVHILEGLLVFLKYMFLFYPTLPLGMLTAAMFQGVSKGNNSLFISLLRTIILQIPMAYTFGIIFNQGLTGVWFGMILGHVIAVSIAYLLGIYTIRQFKTTLTPETVKFK
ncbi:MATE family efflux transporter [Methanococcus maripaludis]|uniref:MatE family member (Drug/sodium antiporters) n=3 Tax=Methanococcus maripaludis TaxID=39152 RepID=Q6M0V2_METMP|nr:MATE family efflux transporter [Methanococcus maripaludis]MBA2859034.1 putative MATE family efflux protein [Methanococcus maripaludis]MBB6068220.1 putative MATE family efflux protein [Methanococcus maripaludis]MBM7409908.1 putative MATE family efflux protein [Methanococcus maripaludis]MBP2219238.1 putative MATE family efflux protein [Methanococcus maripaludis]CAF29722.1 MatE family member (drug/sodium antiporters) [Methanococcus maripaludis S2]